ncbi:MAG: NAD-dependent epimerase/dehydratase family protein, partial [Chloroflexi bacterium]|nr:NAD-dependent epimerase/dehydratase family protein [Chloroflexota bacterium]
MRFLVTGGAGFLGAALANRLVAEGHAVRVLDDLSSGDRSRLDQRV